MQAGAIAARGRLCPSSRPALGRDAPRRRGALRRPTQALALDADHALVRRRHGAGRRRPRRSRRGEIRAIIGPNGAGKSSLINVISGVYRPDSGQRSGSAASASRACPTAAARRARRRPHLPEPRAVPGPDVLDNVAIGPRPSPRAPGLLGQVLGLPRARARGGASARRGAPRSWPSCDLERAGATGRSATLPYGLQKRVELARALVARPRLLLLDEPMAGMTATEKQRDEPASSATRATGSARRSS